MAFLIALEKNMPNKWVRLILMPSNGLIQNKKRRTRYQVLPQNALAVPQKYCCYRSLGALSLRLRKSQPSRFVSYL